MEFKEAYLELAKNNKIRRKAWDDSFYIMNDDGKIKSFREECVPFVFDLSIISSLDWVVINDTDAEFSFVDVIDLLKQGRKVKLKDWPDDCFVEITKDQKSMFMRRISEYDFTPTFECFAANDWEVL